MTKLNSRIGPVGRESLLAESRRCKVSGEEKRRLSVLGFCGRVTSSFVVVAVGRQFGETEKLAYIYSCWLRTLQQQSHQSGLIVVGATPTCRTGNVWR